MKICIAQFNPIIGDVSQNAKNIIDIFNNSSDTPIDMIVFPELALCGYPPMDLLDQPWFIRNIESALSEILNATRSFPSIGLLIGIPRENKNSQGRSVYNSAILIQDGKIIFEQAKSLLPSYDVFDETRYFEPSDSVEVCSFKGETFGITICEDAWTHPVNGRTLYSSSPIETLCSKGAEFIINISASPFFTQKHGFRYKIFSEHSKKYKVPFIFVNQVGGNDELIFDGKSLAIDSAGRLIAMLDEFREDRLIVNTNSIGILDIPSEDIEGSIKKALVLGIKDYFRKCCFKRAVVGLSGGIDSALVLTLAVMALGPENVLAVSMPSPYSSKGSIEDSKIICKNLDVELKIIPISNVFKEMLSTLEPSFEETEPDITEENIQARIRGMILMAFSNKFGNILLSTGNKSELAVGYCTLYGDMSGGISVISDLPKTMVYRLSKYINKDKEIIPESIITKPPSAELRPDQCDQDTLPEYEVLDDILEKYIEKQQSFADIVSSGHDKKTVKWVINAVIRNEYKRKQAALGLKVTSKAFGFGRRFPIAAKYSIDKL